jgi:hypothetical protein
MEDITRTLEPPTLTEMDMPMWSALMTFVIWVFFTVTGKAGRGSMSAPTLTDVDNDGKTEIVISLKDVIGEGKGGVQIWEVESALNGKNDWPTGRGNYLRTGSYHK